MNVYGLIQSNPDITRQYVEEAILPIQDMLESMDDKLNILLPKKRKQLHTLPLRDPVYTELFEVFLTAAGSSAKYKQDLKCAQLKIAYSILFYVGLRVNEIRFFQEKDIQDAIKTSQFSVVHFKQREPHIHVISDLAVKELKNQEFFYRLFQLLSYIKIRESSVYWISNERYRIISFRVSEFLEFIGKEKMNYYQIRKLINFLESLQSLPPIRQYFSDGGFRSTLIFPCLEVSRKKSWCVELAVSERLYFYQYPFSFPKIFLICNQKYQLRVLFFFLKSFSISSLKKEFQIEKFFQTFSVSNSKTKDLRNYMVELFASLESSKRIEPGFEVLLKTNR